MAATDTFRSLHAGGFFLMPNPWDRGSARILQELGFPAVATTSSGHGRSIGKDDQQVTRPELVTHVAELTAMLDIPLNVDSERLFPDDPGGIVETVRLLAEAGAAGCSIEDYSPALDAIDPMPMAAEAVSVAAEACARHGLVLTARAENALYGRADLDDTIERLLAYREAGAEVLYAPGLESRDDIARVVDRVQRPINVLLRPNGPAPGELAALGVRRASTGGALYNRAYATLRDAATELLG